MVSDKICFIASQIGRADSKERKQSEYIFELLTQTLNRFGYELIRADKISSSGSITEQIIKKLFEADLLVADLSDKNANVFYELAIRHATNKPFIQIIEEKEINHIPFDIQNQRTLPYHYSGILEEDNKSNKIFIDEFEKFIKSCEFTPHEIKNPILAENSSVTFLNNEDKPTERTITDIISLLAEKLKSIIPNQPQSNKFTKGSLMAFNKTTVDILDNIKLTLEKSSNGIISCSGPLIVSTFSNFINYTQSSFVAVSVNDLDFWMHPEGKEYLEITTEQHKRYKDIKLERIFVVGKNHKLNEVHFRDIFSHQIENNYKIGFVIDDMLKNITDNILKLDFGLFDKSAVSFFRLENGRFFEIDTTKDTCKKYTDYYEQIKRKCIKYDSSDEVLISKKEDLKKIKEILITKHLFDKK